MKLKSRRDARRIRHDRVRKRIRGTAERPRLSIMISNRHMHVQFIDDEQGITLASATTHGMEHKNNVATAAELGKKALEKATEVGVKRVVVDRGGHLFSGRVKALVDPLKRAGLLTGAKEEK